MKMQANWLLIPAVALGLGACNKKEEVKAPETPAAVAETPKTEAPAPPPAEAKPTPVSAEERAAKLGFAKHLPQDTEVVLAFYNGTQTANRVKNSKLWKLVQNQMGVDDALETPDAEEETNEDGAIETAPEAKAAPDAIPDAAPETAPGALSGAAIGAAAGGVTAPEAETKNEEEKEEEEEEKDLSAEEPAGPAALFGTEFTLALGKTTGEQAGNLLTLNRRLSYLQMRTLAKAFAAAVKSGDSSDLGESFNSYSPELFKELLKDPQSGIALFEKAKMPPLYLAFKTKEADRAAAAQQVAGMTDMLKMMLGEMIEPVTLEAAGQKFEGSKIPGAKISATLAENREDMEEEFDAATVDQLLAAVAKKDIIIASGTIGDYVVLFVGGSADDFKLAGNVGQSLVAADALAFADGYVSKDIAALVYGEKALVDTLIKSAGGLSDMTNGLRDGLAGAEGLGDTRDLEAMFQIVADREAALRKLTGNDATGTVAFFEDGLKIESSGGTDSGMLDWKSPNKLGHLGNSEDVLLFADMTVDATYDKAARAYLEALLETGYAMTMKVAEAPLKDENMAQFQEMAKLFDSKFRPDMVALWDAMSQDFNGGLGKESAWIVDLKGGAPAVPGIPQKVVDKAKVPRISIISPVTDRAKLAAAWDKTNTILTGTCAKISEMTGAKIPMQKPISSEKNGNTTWFFPMPFFTDDFLPSVTVGDKWFAASTSKNQALDLIAKAEAGGESRTGFWFCMNFKTLEKYADETLKLVDENAEAVTGSPLEESDKKTIKDAITILSDLDKLTVHSRRDGGVLRSSVHFKTR